MPRKPKPKRILFAASEAVPFAKTGGLGDVAGTLPHALKALGEDVALILPCYTSIPDSVLQGAKTIASFDVSTPKGVKPTQIIKVEHLGLPCYLVSNDEYFGRNEGLYGYNDDNERFAYFSYAISTAIAELEDFAFDVVHCNDWQTALVPVYLKCAFAHNRRATHAATVFTVHNAQFQGEGPESDLIDVLGLRSYPTALGACSMDDGRANMMRGALSFADWVSTVSPTYTHELGTPQFGERLDPLFRMRQDTFSGILNGIDLDVWNPATDNEIAAPYQVDDLTGKAACKKALQEEMGLAVDADRPLITMVSRLTDQKGVSMVCDAMPRLMDTGAQLAVLGTGDPRLEGWLCELAGHYPGQLACAIRFDSGLSHRMYAGGDLFLMPSLFEPCGLSQMISMRYGTLPVVRETGGLKDSVQPYNKYTGEGTGFSFANAYAQEMADITIGAIDLYRTNRDAWNELQRHAMQADFSWSAAAESYREIYHAVGKRR